MKIFKTVLQIVLALAVLGGGFLAAKTFVEARPQAKKAPPKALATLVEVTATVSEQKRVRVTGMGTVVPARTVTIQPEVSGAILEHHPQLIVGGRVAAGDTLVRIDPRDYQLAVDQQQANVSSAMAELQVERGRTTIAEREWKLLESEQLTGDGATDEGRALALRKPHLKARQVALASARSGLERARLNVERTVIKAPFNAVVKEETVENGLVVGPASRLLTLIATDEFHVQVAVAMDELRWLAIPGVNAAAGEGSTARVAQSLGGGRSVVRSGRVVGLVGELDPMGKMARLLVAVDKPLDVVAVEGSEPLPLLLGAYVEVGIEGSALEQVVPVPRNALREGGKVWVMGEGDKLEIRDVDIVWRTSDHVFVRAGVTAGERLVVSRIGTPVAGMALRTGPTSAADAAPTEAPSAVAAPATAAKPSSEAAP